MKKSISVDEYAYELLNLKKQVLRENGMPYPTFSDAIRLACGKLSVRFDQNIDDVKAQLEKEEKMKEKMREQGIDV